MGQCCAESIRFGDEFGYRFDLGNARSAQLRINLGAHAAKPWKLLVSKDDKQYTLELAGKSWPAWHAVVLDQYLTGPAGAATPLYVRVEGENCQLREVVLESFRRKQ